MLEDSEDDAGLISRALKREGIAFALQRVENRNDFMEAIDSFHPHVILCDHALPQFNSIEAFKLFKERGMGIPFILVTGTVSEEFAVNVIKQGVDDYILKGNLSRLPSAVLSAIGKRNAEKEKLEAQQRIALQNEELMKINHELDNFVYSVSHNLRSPLLSVLGLINILKKEEKLTPKALPLVQMMKQSVLQLDDTLKNIVDYSHNTHNEIAYAEIDWVTMINLSFQHFSHLDQVNKMEKQIHVNGDTLLFSDPHRLTILLRNLISNAIYYWDEKKEKSIIAVTVSNAKDQATLVVQDNGVGVDKELIPKVFNMFYRAHPKSNGAGLGLYVTREIVNKLGGSIVFNSELNSGTRVVVTVPNIARKQQ